MVWRRPGVRFKEGCGGSGRLGRFRRGFVWRRRASKVLRGVVKGCKVQEVPEAPQRRQPQSSRRTLRRPSQSPAEFSRNPAETYLTGAHLG